MSTRSVPTTIIGPKRLLRDSLASLLAGYSYRVTDSHGTAAEMTGRPEDGPLMVLLTVRTMEGAVSEAALIREICPDCKIVALPEEMPGEDFHLLARSAIDGCIPLQVSQEVLARTLDLVMSDSARIIVMADDRPPPAAETRAKLGPKSDPKSEPKFDRGAGTDGSGARSEEADVSEGQGCGSPSLVPRSDAAPPTAARQADVPRSGGAEAETETPKGGTSAIRLSAPAIAGEPVRPAIAAKARSELLRSPPARRLTPSVTLVGPTVDCDRSFAGEERGFASPGVRLLSERERQIIDGLIKGQPNKTIARVCGITEATVKVHMKAILRKVPCSNRTQVAIWALGHADSVLVRSASPGAAE